MTFIDTPGHAAFDEMRSRGANVTDLVILAVAADDGVMAQTVQSIKAAKSADVPIIVALTKSDKPNADAQKVKLELLEQEVILEEFGGDVLHAQVSAITGDGIDSLFEQIGMQSEILDLKANPDRAATGTVIEAKQVQGQGAVATVLVQRGTLHVGDIVVAGAQWGRVRTLVDDSGTKLEESGPSMAVELVGLSGLPEAGDALTVTPDDQKARELAETRQRLARDRRSSAIFAANAQAQQQAFLGGQQGLPTKLLDFVVKADVQGSAEALSSALAELEAADDKLQVKTRVLRSGAGAITNEDIMLASVNSASTTIIGFNSVASAQQREEALKNGVDIREYSVVYDALDDVRAMMASLIRPPPSKQLGELVGTLDVQQLFKIGAIGKVAGCKVLTGYIKVGCNIRILRGNIIVYEGKLQSLRSFKDLVERVDAPDECGMSFDDFKGWSRRIVSRRTRQGKRQMMTTTSERQTVCRARVRASCVTTLHERFFVGGEVVFFLLRHEGLLCTPSGHGCALRECEWRRERERRTLLWGESVFVCPGVCRMVRACGMFLKKSTIYTAQSA